MGLYQIRNPTCFPLDNGSEKLCLRELVDPILLDIDPSNLWDNWCWLRAIDRACLCKNSSSARSFLCDRFILLLLDPLSFVSFFDMHINRLPILGNWTLNKTQKFVLPETEGKQIEKSTTFPGKQHISKETKHCMNRNRVFKESPLVSSFKIFLFSREKEKEENKGKKKNRESRWWKNGRRERLLDIINKNYVNYNIKNPTEIRKVFNVFLCFNGERLSIFSCPVTVFVCIYEFSRLIIYKII